MKPTRKKSASTTQTSATKKSSDSKMPTTSPPRTLAVVRSRKTANDESAFQEIVGLIEQARRQAYLAVNTTLIDLYWQVGEYIGRKLETAAWGEGVVDQLAKYIARKHPEIKGFARPNLF